MTSDDFKVEAYKQETDRVFITLLTFSSSELTEDIRIASDPFELLPEANVLGVVSNGLEYIFTPFDPRLPQDDKTGRVTAKLSIENVSQTIVGHLRSVRKPVNLKIEVVLSSDPDYVETEYDGFVLSNVEYDVFSIEGTLSMDYWELEPFPSGRFNPSNARGLFKS